MEEILHQLIGSISNCLQGFLHPRWLFGISAINSIMCPNLDGLPVFLSLRSLTNWPMAHPTITGLPGFDWRPRGDGLFPTCRRKRSKQIPSPTKNAHNDFGSLFPCYTRLQSSELQTTLQMVWCFCTEGSWGWEHALPKTKIFSENRPFPKGKQSLNSHFSETMFVVGRIISFI